PVTAVEKAYRLATQLLAVLTAGTGDAAR
ncbi:MAG: hypothetical protein AVDCRST_MAG48-1119, partial [uncultured Friedmanniella sp.]